MHINPKRMKKKERILKEGATEALNWRVEYDEEDGFPLYILDLADGRQITTTVRPPDFNA